MRILDIFSKKPEQELSLEEIENLVTQALMHGKEHEKYQVLTDLPEGVDSNAIECRDELLREHKQVAFLVCEKQVIGMVGYLDS